MTATTVPQSVDARSWNTLLKLALIALLIVVLAVGAFAFGRSSADEGGAAPSSSPVPAPSSGVYTPIPSMDDVPPVSQHKFASSESAESTCVPAAHTAPC